jgi:hypothetical protein
MQVRSPLVGVTTITTTDRAYEPRRAHAEGVCNPVRAITRADSTHKRGNDRGKVTKPPPRGIGFRGLLENRAIRIGSAETP